MARHETLGKIYLAELEAEVAASRKCLERTPLPKLFKWKPHPKSMEMGYLAIIVAEIPKWITLMIEEGDIDLAFYKLGDIKTTDDLVKAFDDNMIAVRKALKGVSDADLAKPFSLKSKGQVLFTMPTGDSISSTINHMVHHRGQLTVYMRLNEIPVPAIYGSSADEKVF